VQYEKKKASFCRQVQNELSIRRSMNGLFFELDRLFFGQAMLRNHACDAASGSAGPPAGHRS
jgi:hypothetical protein